jgi:hypothetical protein
VSRWAETFRASLMPRDTADSFDTSHTSIAEEGRSVLSVSSVMASESNVPTAIAGQPVVSSCAPEGEASVELGTLPAAPCTVCGFGLWWRTSVLSGGPGPWTCWQCSRPNPIDWLDAIAFPMGVRDEG